MSFNLAGGIAAVDMTALINAIVMGIFSVVAAVITYVIDARMKDNTARSVLKNAIANSLGAIQKASIVAVTTAQPSVALAGIPPLVAVGVQYVLDHASDEAATLKQTPAKIAEKIIAQQGLGEIALKLASAAGTASNTLSQLATTAPRINPAVSTGPTFPLVPRTT